MATMNREVINKVIQKIQCPKCSGKGYLRSELADSFQNCYKCKGFGKIEDKQK